MQADPSGHPTEDDSQPTVELSPAEAFALRERHPELFAQLREMAGARATHDELLIHAINRGLDGNQALALISQIPGRPIELTRASPAPPSPPRANTGYNIGTRSPPEARREPAFKVGGGSRIHALIAIVFGLVLLFIGGGFSLITGGAFDDGGTFVYFPWILGVGVFSLAGGIGMLFKK